MGKANAINLSGSAGLVTFNSPTFATTATTQYGTLVGSSNQNVTAISPGTAGAILISGGASADPAYVVPTAGTGLTLTTSSSQLTFNQPHGWVLIQSQTASTSSQINFSSGVTGYTNYMLVASGMTKSTNSYPRLSLSTDGGSTFITLNWGNYSETYAATGFGSSDASSGTLAPLGGTTSTTTTTQDSFTIFFFNLTNGLTPSFEFKNITGSSTQAILIFGGAYASGGAATVNYIRIDRSASATFNGVFKLYGLG